MSKLPTDRQILRKIHDKYYNQFIDFNKGDFSSTRDTKIYAPIDIILIAKELKADPEIIFGRLYYHLDKKYRYEQSDGSKVNLFALRVVKDIHAVNFHYFQQNCRNWKNHLSVLQFQFQYQL